MGSFLKEYSKGKHAGVWNLQKCNYNTPPLQPNQRCGVSGKKAIDFSYDTPCTKAEFFGYFHGQPCLVVKLNKVFGWEPEPYYNITEVRQLGGNIAVRAPTWTGALSCVWFGCLVRVTHRLTRNGWGRVSLDITIPTTTKTTTYLPWSGFSSGISSLGWSFRSGAGLGPKTFSILRGTTCLVVFAWSCLWTEQNTSHLASDGALKAVKRQQLHVAIKFFGSTSKK